MGNRLAMTAIGWRTMGPVFQLGLRGMLVGRRWLVVAVLDALFLALALIVATATSRTRAEQQVVDIYRNLALPVLVSFVCLLFGTEALGSEVEDRTLIYLTLRPIPARTVVLPKLAAAVVISLCAVWLALVPGFFILTRASGAGRLLAALVASSGLGVLAYTAAFVALGLVMRRSLIVGVVYILFWEGAVAGLSPSAAHLSIRYYALGIFSGILSRPDLIDPAAAGPAIRASLLVLLLVVVAAMALCLRRLRRMALP